MAKLKQHWSSYLPPFGIIKKEGANSQTEGVCYHHHFGNGGKSTCDTFKCFGTVMRLAILVTHKQFTTRNKQGKANQKQDNFYLPKGCNIECESRDSKREKTRRRTSYKG